MNSFAFSQLNVLTPSPGVSPANGPDQDRSELTLSFPCDGNALQAQLEAWTNTTFSFDDFGPGEFKEKDDTVESQRYGAGSTDASSAFAFGLNGNETVDLESLLAPSSLGPAALDPFHDYAPLAPSLVDPALHLPNFSTEATVSAAAPGLLQTPIVPAATPLPAPVPIQKATKKAAAPKAKKAKTTAASTPASDAGASPGLVLDGDEAANALAIEEDKRRRNTAASARFRIKKKQREAALEQSAKELRDRVAALEGEVEALRTENGWLRGLITEKPVKDEETDPAVPATRKRARVDEADSLVV